MVDLSSLFCVNVYQRLCSYVSWLWYLLIPSHHRLLWRQTGQVAVLHKASSLCAVIVLPAPIGPTRFGVAIAARNGHGELMRFSGKKWKKTKEKCWDFSHPNKYQPYSPLFEMGMGHKLQGNLLALTSQHSWASHSKRCSSPPKVARHRLKNPSPIHEIMFSWRKNMGNHGKWFSFISHAFLEDWNFENMGNGDETTNLLPHEELSGASNSQRTWRPPLISYKLHKVTTEIAQWFTAHMRMPF